MPARRHPVGPRTAACAAADPAPCRPFARRHPRPASAARARPPGAAAKGLCVSQVVQGFLENLLVERQIRHGTLKPLVLLLKLLELLGRVGLHAAVLFAPAVEGGLADGELLADLADGGPAIELGIGFTQLADD